jgi:hypothetical protein
MPTLRHHEVKTIAADPDCLFVLPKILQRKANLW